MGIENRIPIEEVNAIIRKRIEAAEKAIINTLKYIGEMCVNEARSNGDYIDRTGNLRSSIGYVVLRNRTIEAENFKKSARGTDKTKGINNAQAFVKELMDDSEYSIILIVVAGMNYATYVESRRNVLASAQILAERETPRMMKELGFIRVR